MDKLVPFIRALVPAIFLGLSALGIQVSDDIQQVVADNISAILVAGAVLSATFPSLRAAFKFGKDAK